MEVKTKKMIYIPYMNLYIQIGAILKVIDELSNNYICDYAGYCVIINKNECEEVEK